MWKELICDGIVYPTYLISDTGEVRTIDRIVTYSKVSKNGVISHVSKHETGRNHSGIRTDGKGYKMFRIHENGNIVRNISYHRAVAETFIPNPDNKPVVNHKDGNIKNNAVDNLEWVTVSENKIHGYKYMGSKAIKFSRDECDEIIKKWASGYYSNKQLCIEYNMSPAQVSRIANKKRRGFGF